MDTPSKQAVEGKLRSGSNPAATEGPNLFPEPPTHPDPEDPLAASSKPQASFRVQAPLSAAAESEPSRRISEPHCPAPHLPQLRRIRVLYTQ